MMVNYAIQIKLQELAEQAAHSLENRPQIIADAFRLAQSENDETLLAFTIADLSPYLENETLNEAHRLALKVNDPLYRGLALISLAARFPNRENEWMKIILKDALTTWLLIDSVAGQIDMGSSLLNLLAFTKNDDYGFAVERFAKFVETMDDSSRRVHGLALLSTHLQGEAKSNALQQAQHIAELIEDTATRMEAFDTLAPYLSNS